MKKILIQYLWLFLITLFLLVAGLTIQNFEHLWDENKKFQKEWEEVDKQLEKEKNDSNK
jgi:DNA primase large subunit